MLIYFLISLMESFMIALNRCMSVLYIVGMLKNALFILPVLMLYYGYKGVSIGEFFLIQGFSSLVVFFTEVPTGYIADIFSRKKVAVLGFLVWSVGYLFWIFGYGFWPILIGELIFGLSLSLLSGTFEAYMFDLLKKRGKEGLFHKKFAKYNVFSNIGLFVATISGSVLYEKIGADETVWLCFMCSFIAFVLMLFMPEISEAQRVVSKDKSKIKDIIDIFIKTLKNKSVRDLMLFSGIYGVMTLVLMWGLQAVMIERNVPVMLFGVILGINSLGRIIWSSISGKLYDKLRIIKIFKLMLIILFIAYLGAIFSLKVEYVFVYVCLALMIIGCGAVILSRISISTQINHITKSDERATVLSVKSMADKMCTSFGMMALKPLFDTIGIGNTFVVTFVLIVPLFVLFYRFRKNDL